MSNYHWHGDGGWHFDTFNPCEDSYEDDEDSFDFDDIGSLMLEKDEKFLEIRSLCDEYVKKLRIPVVR